MTNQPEQPVVLVIAYLNSQVAQQLPLLRLLKSQGDFSPYLLFLQQEALKKEFAEELQRVGIPVIQRDGQSYHETKIPWSPLAQSVPKGAAQPKFPLVRRLIRKTPLPAMLTALRLTIEGLSYLNELLKLRRNAKTLFDRLRPSVLIMPEENVLSKTTVWTKTARKQGIAVIIIPYTLANATEFAESVHKAEFLIVTGFWNRVIAKFFPRWVFHYKQKELLLLPWPRILVLQILQLSPPNPWMLYSGFASIICAESNYMRQYFIDGGIPSEQISIIGSMHDDSLSQVLKEHDQRLLALRSQYALDHRPIILCALPPPWFPRPECEYQDFSSMVDDWMTILLSQQHYQVLVHLHPRLRYEDFTYLESAFKIKLINKDISKVLPLSNIFVASISATIRWAIACGIPVINYDVYQWGFHDYDSALGVRTINSRKDFESEVHRITSNLDYLRDLQQKQSRIKNEWGLLDGQSGQRLLTLMHSFTK